MAPIWRQAISWSNDDKKPMLTGGNFGCYELISGDDLFSGYNSSGIYRNLRAGLS